LPDAMAGGREIPETLIPNKALQFKVVKNGFLATESCFFKGHYALIFLVSTMNLKSYGFQIRDTRPGPAHD
jgi:hypothetical protein